MITHTAFDWLFRHALLSIKTSTSFLKGGNRGIANHKYAVRRAQLKKVLMMGKRKVFNCIDCARQVTGRHFTLIDRLLKKVMLN